MKNSKVLVPLLLMVFGITLIVIGFMLNRGKEATFMVDNSVYATSKIKNGKIVDMPENPTKSDAEFLYWTLNGSEYEDETLNKSVTLKAKFIALKEDVILTFQLNNGSEDIVKEAKRGKIIEFPETPIKENTEFVGWYYKGQLLNESSTAVGDMTIEAKYKDDDAEYKVTFKKNNNTSDTVVSVKANTTVSKPLDPEKNGEKFLGWYLNGTLFDFNTLINADTLLEAKYESKTKKYQVVFKRNNGDKDIVVSVDENNTVSAPQSPSKQGYKFIGWYLNEARFDFNTKINNDITLEARYEKSSNSGSLQVKYTVKFDYDGGGSNSEVTVLSGESVSAPQEPSKEGYKFAGWYDGNAKVSFPLKVTKNYDLVAKYTINGYAVVFNPDNGSSVIIRNVNYNELLHAPSDPVKEGYTFIGWYDGNVKINFPLRVTRDYKLGAKYTANKCTVEFNPDNGSSPIVNTVDCNTTINAPSDPAKEGYVFIGWFNGDVEAVFPLKVTNNMSFVAVYKKP